MRKAEMNPPTPIIPDYVREALSRSADYSKEFDVRIIAIRDSLSERLKLPIRIDDDMNYNHGQKLYFGLLNRPPFGFDERARIEVRIYISSCSDLFCILCFDRAYKFVKAEESMYSVLPEKFPEAIQSVIKTCRGALLELGFREVENALLDVIAPDCLTELDDIPATIFEALFAEVG
jgi:hypothetical protein